MILWFLVSWLVRRWLEYVAVLVWLHSSFYSRFCSFIASLQEEVWVVVRLLPSWSVSPTSTLTVRFGVITDEKDSTLRNCLTLNAWESLVSPVISSMNVEEDVCMQIRQSGGVKRDSWRFAKRFVIWWRKCIVWCLRSKRRSMKGSFRLRISITHHTTTVLKQFPKFVCFDQHHSLCRCVFSSYPKLPVVVVVINVEKCC